MFSAKRIWKDRIGRALRDIKMSEPRRIGQLAIFIISMEFCSSRAAKKKKILEGRGWETLLVAFLKSSVFCVPLDFHSIGGALLFPLSLPPPFSVLFESHLHKTIEGEGGISHDESASTSNT